MGRRADGGLPLDVAAPGIWGGGAGNGSSVVARFVASLGSWDTDPSAYIRFVRPRRLTWPELDALHTDAIGKRIAELPGHEATREGYRVRPQGAKDGALAGRVVDWLTARTGDLELLSRIFEARWRRRTFGSCLVVAGTEDCFVRGEGDAVIASDFSRELTRGAKVRWLRTFDARYYRVVEMYGEGHPLCGQPKLYEVHGWDRPGLDADYYNGARVPATSSVKLVHASRVWRDAEPEGWAIFDGLARDLSRMLSGAKGADDALSAMAVPVFEIMHLRDKVERDEAGVRDHVYAQNQAMGLSRPLIVDKGQESFQWQSLSLGGVSDVVNSLGYILSAATGIPMTLLFGMSPGGFSGGESEEDNWHNYVRSVQRELGAGVSFVLRLLLAEAGIRDQDFEFKVEWNKLVVLDDLEAADVRDKASSYWTRIIDAGIVKAGEVRSSAFGAEGFQPDVTVDANAEQRPQANLGATEATTVLEMITAYYAEGSRIPREAAIAFVVSVDPNSAATAPLMFQLRPEPPPAPAPTAIAAGVPAQAPTPTLGAGAADPATDEPEVPTRALAADETVTWTTAKDIAAKHAITESSIKRWAREGLVSWRRGTGRNGAAQFAEEHVLEVLSGSVVERAPAPGADDEPLDATAEMGEDAT